VGGGGSVEHDSPLGPDLFGPPVVDIGGVWKPIPEWRWSALYQPKNRRQNARASS
jgi:hypothetical protein